MVTRTHVFSRASCRLHVFALSFDWFTGLPVSFVIGQSDCFCFGLTTLSRKLLYFLFSACANRLVPSVLQINMKNFTENTFWAKTKEDKLEKPGLFDELSKTFAAKSAPKKTESGEGLEKKAAAKKKGKDLKIIDPKSAQNLCKSQVF